MAGLNLIDVPTLNLVPHCMRQDPTVKVLCAVADVMFALVHSQIRNVLIWPRIDELEEPILTILAYQMHIEGYEGWHLAETLDQKRRLIKDAYKMHFYKGTRWSLERIFDLLDLPGEIVEWWQAPTPDFPPYTFDMDINVDLTKRSPSSALIYDTLGLIDALKNARSHLRRGTINVTQPPRPVYIGTTSYLRLSMRVDPLIPSRVIARETVPVICTGGITSTTVRIGALTPSRVTSRARGPYINIASQAHTTVRVDPLVTSPETHQM